MTAQTPDTTNERTFRMAFGRAVFDRADDLQDSDPDLAGAINITSTQTIANSVEFNEEAIGATAKRLYSGKKAARVAQELQTIYKQLKSQAVTPQA